MLTGRAWHGTKWGCLWMQRNMTNNLKLFLVSVTQVKPSSHFFFFFLLFCESGITLLKWLINTKPNVTVSSLIWSPPAKSLATSERHFDQASAENTPTLFSLNKRNLLLSRLHPRSPYNHPLLSLFTLLSSPTGLQTTHCIIPLIVAVINRENAGGGERKTDRRSSCITITIQER